MTIQKEQPGSAAALSSLATQPEAEAAALEAALAPMLGAGMPFAAPDLASPAGLDYAQPAFKPARPASRLHHV